MIQFFTTFWPSFWCYPPVVQILSGSFWFFGSGIPGGAAVFVLRTMALNDELHDEWRDYVNKVLVFMDNEAMNNEEHDERRGDFKEAKGPKDDGF